MTLHQFILRSGRTRISNRVTTSTRSTGIYKSTPTGAGINLNINNHHHRSPFSSASSLLTNTIIVVTPRGGHVNGRSIQAQRVLVSSSTTTPCQYRSFSTIQNNNDNKQQHEHQSISSLDQTSTTIPEPNNPISKSNLKISILGPPNAGKSTLFNRLMCKTSNQSTYRLSSEKQQRKPQRSKGRLGNNHPSRQNGGAIVSNVPGTTRDRRECVGRIGGTYFTLVDTAGVDGERISLLGKKKKKQKGMDKDGVEIGGLGVGDAQVQVPLETKMIQQTLEAARQSDVILLMFDARVGLTADFDDIIRWLRKIKDSPIDNNKEWKRQVVILANKLEGDNWVNHYYMDDYTDHDAMVLDHINDVSRLGFGDAIPISAEHGEGMADIAAIIEDLTNKKRIMLYGNDDYNEQGHNETSATSTTPPHPLPDEKPLQLAILGRTNVGKSTLVNSLLRQNRVITGPTPGLTRDSISISWSYQNRPVQLVDTAGIRRMAKRDHTNDIEDLAVRDAMRAMKIADVAVLVLDADAKMLQRQELAIADAVVREGRALVVAANKMDLLVDAEYTKEQYADAVRDQIEIRFPMLRKTPVVSMSSLTGECVEDLMPVVFDARDRWARVIGTGLLNRWLKDVLEMQKPPIVQGRAVRIKYIMQVKGRPPTFMLFCNVDQLPVSYLRYLTRNFQQTFEMFGMEVRLAVKKSAKDNPFHDKDKKRGGSGIGGVDFRKKRNIAILKATGKPKKKGTRRRTQKSRYT